MDALLEPYSSLSLNNASCMRRSRGASPSDQHMDTTSHFNYMPVKYPNIFFIFIYFLNRKRMEKGLNSGQLRQKLNPLCLLSMQPLLLLLSSFVILFGSTRQWWVELV